MRVFPLQCFRGDRYHFSVPIINLDSPFFCLYLQVLYWVIIAASLSMGAIVSARCTRSSSGICWAEFWTKGKRPWNQARIYYVAGVLEGVGGKFRVQNLHCKIYLYVWWNNFKSRNIFMSFIPSSQLSTPCSPASPTLFINDDDKCLVHSLSRKHDEGSVDLFGMPHAFIYCIHHFFKI